MKRQQDIQRTLEDLKGVKNIPNLQRRGCSSLRIKNEKGETHHVSERDCQCLSAIVKNYTTTMNKNHLNKKSERVEKRAAPMCITTTPMR